MKRLIALCFLASSAAHAGDQYIDTTGFAAGGYDVVAYHQLEAGSAALPGSADFTAEHNGAVWTFSSADNRDLFAANPAKYAPQYDGHCAYGVAQGAKVPANPNLWKVVDDKLYLNILPSVAKKWEKKVDRFLKASEKKWTKLETANASTDSWRAMRGNKGTFEDNTPSM